MLWEMMSPEFQSNGQWRGPIRFNKGLNVVLGGEQSDNSIGKSTTLLAIDFCFGGDTYSRNLNLPAHFSASHHTIYFSFRFGETQEYYARSIATPQVVSVCDASYQVLGTMKLDEFRQHLFEMYHIGLPFLSFRDIVGRYMRIYGKDNYNEKRPLQAYAGEGYASSIEALEKLFDYNRELESLRHEVKVSTQRKKAFHNAEVNDVLTVRVPTVSQFKENKKEIQRLEQELQTLTKNEDVSLTDETATRTDEALELKKKLTMWTRRRSKLLTHMKLLELNHQTSLTQENCQALSDFFPGINMKKLEEVQVFHRQIQELLRTQIEDEMEQMKTFLDATNQVIQDLQEQHRQLGIPVTVSQNFLNQYGELNQKITALKAQNKACELSRSLIADVRHTKQALEDTESGVLDQISHALNEKMAEFNDFIYSEPHPSPEIQFGRGPKYDFYTPYDGGMGTGCKGLILLDLSILQLTKLPVLIHDSLLFNPIGDQPLEKIMELYTKSKKQIFIAYDRQEAPTQRMKEILDTYQVLHLSQGGNELFGYSWAKRSK